jgi:hypothetical protein
MDERVDSIYLCTFGIDHPKVVGAYLHIQEGLDDDMDLNCVATMENYKTRCYVVLANSHQSHTTNHYLCHPYLLIHVLRNLFPEVTWPLVSIRKSTAVARKTNNL